MKLLFTLQILLLLLVPFRMLGAEPTAASVVARASQQLAKAPSVTATFTASQQGETAKGEITMAGNRFEILAPALSLWFDGRTQWAYSPSANEVNITEPTRVELLESNPLTVLDRLTTDFAPRRLKGSASSDVIELTPKQKSDIKKLILTLDKKTMYPTEIKVITSSGSSTLVKITSMQTGPHLPLSHFQFPSKKYPKAEIVDLR